MIPTVRLFGFTMRLGTTLDAIAPGLTLALALERLVPFSVGAGSVNRPRCRGESTCGISFAIRFSW